MYNIYDVFENYKFNKLVNDDFNKIIEFTENYDVFEKTVVMEGYLDDLIYFEPVTESVKDVFDKIIEFIKNVWKKIKEWIGKVIGLFRKKDKDYVKKSDAEVKAIGEKLDGENKKPKRTMADVQKDLDDFNRKNEERIENQKKEKEREREREQKARQDKEIRDIIDKEKRRELESKKVPIIKFDNTYELLKHTEIEVSVPDMEDPQDVLDYTFKVFTDTVDYIKDQLVDENMKTIEDFNAGLSAIFGGKNLDEVKKSMLTAYKDSDEADMMSTHNEPVKNIADILMEYLENTDKFVKEFESISRLTDKYMNVFIKKIEQCKKDEIFNRSEAHNVSMMVQKGLGIVESIIRFGIRQVGINYDRCKAIVDRVKGYYASAVNTALEL